MDIISYPWLNTLPPRCAIPMVSALITFIPFAMAAAAMSFEASTVPCPPTPQRIMLIFSDILLTSVNGSCGTELAAKSAACAKGDVCHGFFALKG